MKGDSNVIFLIIAVIVGASILLMSLGIIGKASRGIDDIQNTGLTEQQRLAGAVSLSQTCEQWLYGDKYSAEAILSTYKLPEKMKPFSSVDLACGENIKTLAQNCLTREVSGCAGDGLIESDAYEITDCTRTCSNVIEIFGICETSCPDKKLLCFEGILNYFGSSELKKTFEVSTSEVDKACEGRLG